MTPPNTVTVTIDRNAAEICRIFSNLLSLCEVPLECNALDVDLYNECKEILLSESSSYRDSMSSDPLAGKSVVSESWLKRYLTVGVLVATDAYGHLNNKAAIRYIVLYSTFVTSLDDVFEKNAEHMSGFNERLIKGLPQGEWSLDAFAKLLVEETPRYFGRLASNMIITSTLDFVTSLSLDLYARNMRFNEHLHNFAIMCRNMSGIAHAYAMFIFPKDVPFDVYVKCLPDMQSYINHMNDVCSFYKEDLAQETENLASVLGQIHPSTTKYEVLQSLADKIAESDSRIRIVLADFQPALEAYEHFRKGYVSFHVSSGRYKLDELFLSSGSPTRIHPVAVE